MNAYEEGDEVILIACRMSSTNVLNTSSQDPTSDIPLLHRWRFNLRTGAVAEEKLDDVPAEFPRINENLTGRKNQYGYAGKMAKNPQPLFDGIIKYNFSNGQSQTHEFGEGRYGGEAIFAPSLNASTEDDGWVLTFVHDENSQTSELVVINAQDITSEPVARVILPQRVPYGFHGAWIGDN
jgi:carotenoid cleavage dioxygenase